MKRTCVFIRILVALAVLFFVAATTTAWAEEPPLPCPASPDYSPDFSLDQSCLTLNFNAAFVSTGEAGPVVLRLTPASGNKVGSAWFNTAQTVKNGFTTSFQFKLTNPSQPPADGIAFVIQNSGLNAIGFTEGNGGALGYGDRDNSTNPSTGEGIPNSLAIEFDTFTNGWDADANHVAVQSCGIGRNTSHHNQLCQGNAGPNSTLGRVSVASPTFADGAVHKVTITYTPPAADCVESCFGSLHVILDDVELFPDGISVNLDTLLSLGEGGTALVGFTGATGADFENQDILTWTFASQSQSVVVTQGEEAVAPFQDNAYNYGAQLNTGNATTVTITPILTDQNACNNLVGSSFPGAKCFVYTGLSPNPSSSVMFELTCPQLPSNPECNPFDAELATRYDILEEENPGFDPFNPFPGWLKGRGPDPDHPCTPNPGNDPPLFQSNQIDFFSINRDDPHTKGGSGGTGSCWVATYNQPNEERPGINITSPAGTYAQNQVVTANYTCSDPSTTKPPSSLVGPYLTAASCTQTTNPGSGSCLANGSGLTCTGAVDTSTVGQHTFEVTALDSGSNPNSQSVTYNVVGSADLAILKLALPKIPTGKKLVYGIAAVDLGANAAVGVVVTDPLPAGTSFVSASGSNVYCSFVNGKLKCNTTPISCVANGTLVTCNVGGLAPFSWSPLNVAAIQITVQVNAAPGVTLKNTATVSGINTDPKPSNNSSTASTLVTR